MHHSPKTAASWTRIALLALALSVVSSRPAFAQTTSTNRPWAYLLLHDSYLLDDCPVCGRIPIQVPMRGTFNLRVLEQNTLSSRYAIEDISFKAGERPYRVKGG